jgi:hypothetical protein
MITITVDCNSDVITLNNGDGKPIHIPFKAIRDARTIEQMLYEVLNMTAGQHVTLKREDEDLRTIVGEW